jgi:CBS domain-containing protein
MLVRDVMSSPAITVKETAPANRVADLMAKHDVGCIIVCTESEKPIGIITERDLVLRVLAKNVKPDTLKAEEVMTTPLITVEPEANITDTARRMSRLNVRRLGVIYKGDLVGIISSKDVLGVMPELFEIMHERAIIEGESIAEEEHEEEPPLAGYCDHCGVWSDTLTEVNGEYHCEDCRIELEENEE